jgi:hypothetical protein
VHWRHAAPDNEAFANGIDGAVQTIQAHKDHQEDQCAPPFGSIMSEPHVGEGHFALLQARLQ